MKKIYIRPVAELEALDQMDILAGSGNVTVEEYTDEQNQYGIDTKLKGGDGNDFGNAKFAFEYSLDIEPW